MLIYVKRGRELKSVVNIPKRSLSSLGARWLTIQKPETRSRRDLFPPNRPPPVKSTIVTCFFAMSGAKAPDKESAGLAQPPGSLS